MRLLRVETVAEILDTSKARVYQLIRLGLLPTVRMGRQLRIPEGKLMQWIDSGGKALPGGWRREPGTAEEGLSS